MLDTISAAGFKFNWTDVQVARLKEMHQQGLSATQIGVRLGTSRNAVIGKLHRLDLMRVRTPAKPKPPRQRQEPDLTAIPAAVRLKPIEDNTVYAPKTTYRGGIREKLASAKRTQQADVQPIEPPPQPRGDKPGLMQLKPGECKWPFGDPRHPDFHYCGQPREEGRPYCAGHARQAYERRAV